MSGLGFEVLEALVKFTFQDMDVEMDDVLDVNVKPDADLMDGLPDLRTVISRPSSVSDADTDDYNIKPNKMMKKWDFKIEKKNH